MVIGIGIGNSFARKKGGRGKPPAVEYLYARFRPNGTGATGGSMNLAEIVFHNKNGPIAYSGETFGQSVTSGNLFDGNPDSRVQMEVGGWAGVGFAKPEVITKMVFRQGQWGESAKAGFVEGSNDKITWDVIRYIPEMVTGDHNVTEYVIAGAVEQKLSASVSQAALIAATLTRSIRLQASVVQAGTANGDFKILPKNLEISRALIVAGGGGGGLPRATVDGTNKVAGAKGGGGGGGFIETSTMSLAAGSYPISVGGGGAPGSNGGNSSFNGRTAIGGGAGGTPGTPGATGGSGGGGAGATVNNNPPANGGGAGTSGQGNAGGAGATQVSGSLVIGGGSGGGGGAGAVGANGIASNTPGVAGGQGKASDITGANVIYGSGGGGGAGGGASTGGQGGDGAGNGGYYQAYPGPTYQQGVTNGLPNRGGGGGGGAPNNSGNTADPTAYTGSGGSGIVVIRYPAPQRATGGTVTQVGGDIVHTFTASGTFTVTL